MARQASNSGHAVPSTRAVLALAASSSRDLAVCHGRATVPAEDTVLLLHTARSDSRRHHLSRTLFDDLLQQAVTWRQERFDVSCDFRLDGTTLDIRFVCTSYVQSHGTVPHPVRRSKSDAGLVLELLPNGHCVLT